MHKSVLLISLILSSVSFAGVEIKIKRKVISPQMFNKINEGQSLDVWKRVILFKKSNYNIEKYEELVKKELKKSERETLKNILLTEIYRKKSEKLNKSFFKLDRLKFELDFQKFETSLIKSWIKRGMTRKQSKEEFVKALIRKGYPVKKDQPLIEAYLELIRKIKKEKLKITESKK